MAHSSGHPTANMAPKLVYQPTARKDSSKDGTVKEWLMNTSYSHRPLARNKEPGMPKMDYGSYGLQIKV